MKVKPRCKQITALFSLLFLAIAGSGPAVFGQAFVHPGCLEDPADFARMNTKVIQLAESPWVSSWNILTNNNPWGKPGYVPNPQKVLVRGTGNSACSTETYPAAMNDAAAAYQLSLRWRINGDTASANTAITILNAWSSTLTNICGDPNVNLNSIYGYEFACAAENMRGYSGWSGANFAQFQAMLQNLFYPLAHGFLVAHDGTCPSYMWANWDLLQMASEAAIGVVCDNRTDYNDAITYFTNGIGNGRIDYNAATETGTVVAEFNNNTLGEGQEEGRDQGHGGLETSAEGVICTIAFHQGDEYLFSYGTNKVLALCEYFADYNLGNTVPYTAYTSCLQSDPGISSASQGDNRPSWDLIYNEYVNRLNVSAPNSTLYAERLRPEGGGGDYGTTSGGFDQLGFTTLTSTIDKIPIANGNYTVVNRSSGMALDNNGSTTPGTSVIQWTVDNWYNQYWTVTYLNNGYYKLTCGHGDECLDGLGNTANGSVAGQEYSSANSFNQQWMIVPVGSYYKLVNRFSGQCLDNDGSTTSGTALQQWDSNPSNNQLWSFTSAPSGGSAPAITSALKVFVNEINAFSYTITATGSPTGYGAAGLPSWLSVNTRTGVISGTPTATGTFLITLSVTNATAIATANLAVYVNFVPFANGEYGIQNHDGNYLDTDGLTGNGANVSQWSSSGSNNQKWNFTVDRDGYYQIVNVADGEAVDTLGDTGNGSTVGQWAAGPSTNQKWKFVPLSGGYFQMVNESTGLCLDTGGLTTNGAVPMQQWGSSGSVNQQWEVWGGH